MEKEELILVEPDPLHFQIRGLNRPGTVKILLLLQQESAEGLTKEEIIDRTSLSLRAVEYGLHQLIEQELVTNTSMRPSKYRLRSPQAGAIHGG